MPGLMSVLLPAEQCERFGAEVLGDLAVCEGRRGRVAYLAGVVIGLPRLALMMWHENRRGHA